MQVSDYAPLAEVRKACQELGIGDWSAKTDEHVDRHEAQAVLNALDTGGLDIGVEAFAQGLEVELEHGIRYPEANVTNNHPLLTGKIVIAHLHETLDYYARLAVMELEADLFEAVRAGDGKRAASVYAELLGARAELGHALSGKLEG